MELATRKTLSIWKIQANICDGGITGGSSIFTQYFAITGSDLNKGNSDLVMQT